MKEKDFENGLKALRGSALPQPPVSIEANVLRRVRLARSDNESAWSWLDSLVPKTGFVATAMALVIVTSSMVTFASASAYTAETKRKSEINRALGFDVMVTTELVALDRK